jgi:hypothetical protein
MKVKCIVELPIDQQGLALGKHYNPGKQTFNLSVGREYFVYGLTFLSGAPWVEILEDFGYLYSAPLCLFEITDARVSRYWQLQIGPDSTVMLWPPSFYREYYFDDLIEGVPDILDDFRKVRTQIEAEVSEGG